MYPEGSEVRRLNTQGSLVEGRQRWFVCKALEGQRVRLERFDHKLLVSYRHMYIREVDLLTGESRSLVVARATSQGAPSVALRAPCGAPCDAPNLGSHKLQV